MTLYRVTGSRERTVSDYYSFEVDAPSEDAAIDLFLDRFDPVCAPKCVDGLSVSEGDDVYFDDVENIEVEEITTHPVPTTTAAGERTIVASQLQEWVPWAPGAEDLLNAMCTWWESHGRIEFVKQLRRPSFRAEAEQRLEAWAGPRCDTYTEGCTCCIGWRALDDLVKLSETLVEHENLHAKLQEKTLATCFNCGHREPPRGLESIGNLFARVEPGEACPDGECSRCGCLHYVEREEENE